MRPSTFAAVLSVALSHTVSAAALDELSPQSAPQPEAPPGEAEAVGALHAQAAREADAPSSEGRAKTSLLPTQASFRFGGYVETFYQLNFNNPSNGITNFRGFDNRHNTFSLSNVALDATWDHENLVGRLTLQVGHTPSTYYLSEPTAAGAGAGGASATSAELWKYIQQAYAGYRFGLGHGLTVTAGLFLSAIGPESMAVRDNWNWSRSNLFFGLPFYHTGVRASYALSDDWSLTIAAYNGWNSVVDSNDEKSVSTQLTYTRPDVAVSVLYLNGIERPRGAPEGRAWRHLLDTHVTWHATPWLSLLAHANGGFEPNEFGVSAWTASALNARFRIVDQLFFAVRGDYFYERVAENETGRASPIFWPAPWVTSGTTTIDFRPHARVSFRLEYRRDQAGADMFFGGEVPGDGGAVPFVTNRASQDTLTVGATTWF